MQLPVTREAILDVVTSRTSELDEVRVASLVHWDLWDTNVFVDPDTLEVVGLIDFERALWGDPVMEAQFLARLDDTAFRIAHGSAPEATPGERSRRVLYDLYLYLVMVIEAPYRRYPTDEIEMYARGRLASTLDRLSSVDGSST